MFSSNNSVTLTEAKKSKVNLNIILQILIFILVMYIAQSIMSVIIIIPTIIMMFTNPDYLSQIMQASGSDVYNITMDLMSSKPILLLTLVVTVFEIIVPILYCKLIEKRPLRSMGFAKRGFLKHYILGFIIGSVMLLISLGLCVLTKTATVSLASNISVLYILAFFIAFIIQGAAEEVLLRGYFFVSLTNKTSVAVAIAISSITFSLMHLANPGINVTAIINIALFGAIMALYMLRTDNIWGVCAIHTAWNFVQGNIVGIQVSGNPLMPTIFETKLNESAKLINGGAFGLEGGIMVTAVELIVIAFLILPTKKKAKTSIPQKEITQ